MPTLACEPFATLEDVLSAPCACNLTEEDHGALIEEYIDEASDFLFVASGGRVAGRCTRTVWPVTDTYGCARWDSAYPGAQPFFDAIPLAGPNTEVLKVTIDGVILNPSEYRLYNGNMLIRRSGSWPTSNDLTKDDTDVGTFTVQERFGEAPSRLVSDATVELVCQMIREPNALSRLRGVTSANIQGVSVATDAAEGEGLPAVARFLDRYAPRGVAVSAVWSPESDNGWRLISVSGPSGS